MTDSAIWNQFAKVYERNLELLEIIKKLETRVWKLEMVDQLAPILDKAK